MYKQISVCVNEVEERTEVISLALKLAQQMNAKLIAYYVRTEVTEVLRWQVNVPLEYANKLVFDLDEYEREDQRAFTKLLENYEVDTKWLTVSRSEKLYNEILCTDLIINEQPNKSIKSFAAETSFLNNLILETKRPVLMIPTGSKIDPLGPNVLIGWNSSAEAMRAVDGSLPILKSAKKVSILEILKKKDLENLEHHDKHVYEIQQYLNHYDINNHLLLEGSSRQYSNHHMLHDRATEEDINLIVIGGYGHSRLRELVMGGMTNHLIEASTIPVLFSH